MEFLNKMVFKKEKYKISEKQMDEKQRYEKNKGGKTEEKTEEQLKEKSGEKGSNVEEDPGGLMKLIKEDADDLSVVGLKHCYDQKRRLCSRVVWVFLVTVGVLSAVYLIIDRTKFYLSYPVMTKLDMVPQKSIQYPQITLCNSNRIRKSAAEELGLVEYFKQFSQPYNSEEKKDVVLVGTNPNYTQDLRDYLSPRISEINCFWKDDACNAIIQNMTYTNSGRCVTINPSLANMSIYRAGDSTSITLIMQSNKSELFVYDDVSAGFLMLLHKPGTPANVKEFGIMLSLGVQHNVVFSTTEVTRQKYPYGSCVDEEGYDPVSCEIECQRNAVVKSCGCKFVYMKGDGRVCDYYEELCGERALKKFFTPSNFEECFCPSLCSDLSYSVSVSPSKFDKTMTREQLKVIGWNTSVEEFVELFGIVTVHVNSMEQKQVISSPAYSFMALMADIGGALSLMLGATLLTIVEVIEMALNACSHALYSKTK